MTIVGKTPPRLLKTEEETRQVAENLAKAIVNRFDEQSRLAIWLVGDLGAGKTTFTRHFLRSLGHTGKVKSPTYNLCEPYQVQSGTHRFSIYHFDLYRMNHPNEWEEAGFRDQLSTPGISLIEWPEKAEGSLPQPDLEIFLTMNADESREIAFSDHSAFGKQLLQALDA